MDTPNDNLKSLIQVISPKKTIEEFLVVFKAAVDSLAKLKNANQAEIAMLRNEVELSFNALSDTTQKDFKDAQGHLLERIDAALEEQTDSLNYMRDWVRNLPQAKDGEDGIDAPSLEEIVPAVLSALPPTKEETGDQLIEKINAGTKLIAASAIGGLEEQLTKLSEAANKKGTAVGWGAHPLTIAQTGTIKAKVARHINFKGTAVSSVVQNPNGTIDVTLNGGAGGTTIYSETPTGLIDGSNKIYTTANAVTSIISIAINGQFIHPGEYTVNASGFTMGTALDASLSGTGFTVVYI